MGGVFPINHILSFRLTILFVIFLINSIANAQDKKLLRIEFDTEEKVFPYSLIALEEQGLMLFYKTTNTTDGEVNWYFAFYNIFLEKVSSKEIPLKENLTYIKDYQVNDTVFLFFHDNSKKSKTNDYCVIAIDIDSKDHLIYQGVLPYQGNVRNFYVFGKRIFMVFNIEDEYQTILIRELSNDITRNILSGENNIIEIEKMIIDTSGSYLHVVLRKSIARKQYELFYYKVDVKGSLLDSLMIETYSEDKQLNKGMLHLNSDDEMIIIGTYIDSEGRSAKPNSETENESSGIFFTKIVDNEQKFIKYYSYLEFENFSVYMSDAEFVKYQRRAQKMERKGKEFSINYNLLVHDILHHNDQYIFAAEAYYPEYHTVSYMTYDYYGRPVPQYYSVFDGYRYTNAIIASFSPEGNVLWSNVFDMYKIISFSLKKRINCFFDKDDIILSYTENGQIASQIINGNEVIGELDFTNIMTNYRNDEIIEDRRNEMEHWYDNYFIIYGYQTIKNSYLSGNRKRTVFYINKIAFQ